MRFTRDLTWLLSAFKPGPDAPATMPEELPAQVNPTVDVFGLQKIGETEYFARGLTDTDTVDMFNLAVPDGFLRMIFFADVFHAVAAATRDLWIEVVAPDGSTIIALTPRFTEATNARRPLDRSVILPQGWRIRGRSATGTGVGNTLQTEVAWVQLPLGEYLAGLP